MYRDIYIALSIIIAILGGLSVLSGFGIRGARDEARKTVKEIRHDLKESKKVLREIEKMREKSLEESYIIHSLAEKADELNSENVDKDKIINEIKNDLSLYLTKSDELAEIKKGISSLEETQKETTSKLESRINDLSKIGKLAEKVSQELPASHYNNLGYYFFKLSKYKEAIEHFTKAIDLKPDGENSYLMRGLCYERLNNPDEALLDYNRAMELNNNWYLLYYNRGVVFGMLGRKEKALSDYNKAVELKPDYASAYNNRGGMYCGLNRKEEALSDYNKAIELKPDYAGAYLNSGELFICTLKFDEAAKLLMENKKVFSIVTDKIISFYLLQLALTGDGKNADEFANEYKAILKKNPDFKLKGWNFYDVADFLEKQEKEGKIPANRLKKMKEIHEEIKKLA